MLSVFACWLARLAASAEAFAASLANLDATSVSLAVRHAKTAMTTRIPVRTAVANVDQAESCSAQVGSVVSAVVRPNPPSATPRTSSPNPEGGCRPTYAFCQRRLASLASCRSCCDRAPAFRRPSWAPEGPCQHCHLPCRDPCRVMRPRCEAAR